MRMVEIIREVGRGGQVLYAYHRMDQYVRFKPYPMKLITFTDPVGDVMDSIKHAREPNDTMCKIDVMIHCNDAEAIRTLLLGKYGSTGANGRPSKWICARPQVVLAEWLNFEIPDNTPLNRMIPYVRRMLKITQVELGRRVNVKGAEVYRVEKTNPSAYTLSRYMKALGFSFQLK